MPTERLSTSLTLNYDAVEQSLFRFGRQGLDRALTTLEQRAKKYAPVRDVFSNRGSGQKRAEAVPRGIQRRKRYKYQSRAFGRKIRHHQDSTRDRFMAQVRAQRAPARRITGESGQRIEGTHKDLIPILAMKDAEGRVTGEGRIKADFRRAKISGGKVQLQADTFQVPGRPTKTTTTGSSFLNPRGRAAIARVNSLVKAHHNAFSQQVKQGKRAGSADEAFTDMAKRASLSYRKASGITSAPTPGERLLRKTALHVDAQGDMRIGGRLRDEIYRTEIRTDGAKMYGDVIAPTEYAKYQEYGTSKHRAQPFMRPALYDMRGRFRDHVARSMRSRGTR
jgi:HK97 gp10 family phage protein